MKSAGVIGWPVAHSKSPLIHRFWLAKLGIDGDYSRFAVHPDRLGEAIRALPALGLAGVNLTVPHKAAALPFLDRVDAVAARTGAANVVVVGDDGSLGGWNTDVAGIIEALAGVELAGASIVVIGAGGAARAAVAALAGSHHQELLVVARDPDKAVAITRPFDVCGLGVPFAGLHGVVGTADLVVNASPLGMTGQPQFPAEVLAAFDRRAGTTVFDMVYAPLETPLLAAARARGLRTIDGLAMLIGQAATAFELFYGATAPREHDAELRDRLAR